MRKVFFVFVVGIMMGILVYDSQKVLAINSNKSYLLNNKLVNSNLSTKLFDTGWIDLMSEGFEGIFPAEEWDISNTPIYPQIYWDVDDWKSHTGYYSAWPGMGPDGVEPPAPYPNNTNTTMKYGPFDLSNCVDAKIEFWKYLYSEHNADFLSFTAAHDSNLIFNDPRWSGYDQNYWDLFSYPLDGFCGDSSVWLGWNFSSDWGVTGPGAWIDDINISFTPGYVTVQGNLTYADRQSQNYNAPGLKVSLYEEEGYFDELLQETTTNPDGNYFFQPILNWDEDDDDPLLANRKRDLFVVWQTVNEYYRVTNLSLNLPYSWRTSVHYNVGSGDLNLSAIINSSIVNHEAMWIFQDLRRTIEYIKNHTYPISDPEFLTARWQLGTNEFEFCQGSCFWVLSSEPYAFIADRDVISSDVVVHETGHHVMYNKTGLWATDPQCLQHYVFKQETHECAWTEGWADFIVLPVNEDDCYDPYLGPCSSGSYNLETHSRLDDPNVYYWDDDVEGRVAGALFDLMDQNNESPGFDSAYWGFNDVFYSALKNLDIKPDDFEIILKEVSTQFSTNISDIKKALRGCSYIIHCAARTDQSPASLKHYTDANIISTALLVCIAKEYNIDRIEGVIVTGLRENSSATEAGIEQGDQIIAVNGVRINNPSELQEQISRYRPNDKIIVTIIRKNKERQLNVTLRNPSGGTGMIQKEQAMEVLGASFGELSSQERKSLGINQGVKVVQLSTGKFRNAGIREGFIITQINNTSVSTPADVEKLVNNSQGGVYIEGIYPDGLVAYYSVKL